MIMITIIRSQSREPSRVAELLGGSLQKQIVDRHRAQGMVMVAVARISDLGFPLVHQLVTSVGGESPIRVGWVEASDVCKSSVEGCCNLCWLEQLVQSGAVWPDKPVSILLASC